MDVESYYSTSSDETFERGIMFSHSLRPGDIVTFYGDLGAGKTQFINGICHALNVEQIVSSPTYTIVNQYLGWDQFGEEITIYHIDLYRIQSRSELNEIGFGELLADSSSVKLIEWSEHAENILPQERCDIRIIYDEGDENGRRIEIIDRRIGVAVLS